MAVETDRLEERMQVRFTARMKEQIRELGRWWGPAVEVSTADVIRIAVDLAHRRESAKRGRKGRAENPQ
jgi:hypothetical protein